MIEPLNLPLVDVRAHDPAVCQNEWLPTESFETHGMNRRWREAQLSGETGVDNNRNLALVWKGLQNNNRLPPSRYCSLDGHVLRNE